MKGKRGKRMQWAVCFGKTAISAAILAACLCGMSAKTARADVIWTPEDSFYEKIMMTVIMWDAGIMPMAPRDMCLW